jgi:hypothetical protein
MAQWYSAGLRRGFESQQGVGIFLFTTASRPALGSAQPPIQWVPGALSLGIRRLGSEANHSPPSSVEVKDAWCSVKAQGQVYRCHVYYCCCMVTVL